MKTRGKQKKTDWGLVISITILVCLAFSFAYILIDGYLSGEFDEIERERADLENCFENIAKGYCNEIGDKLLNVGSEEFFLTSQITSFRCHNERSGDIERYHFLDEEIRSCRK